MAHDYHLLCVGHHISMFSKNNIFTSIDNGDLCVVWESFHRVAIASLNSISLDPHTPPILIIKICPRLSPLTICLSVTTTSIARSMVMRCSFFFNHRLDECVMRIRHAAVFEKRGHSPIRKSCLRERPANDI